MTLGLPMLEWAISIAFCPVAVCFLKGFLIFSGHDGYEETAVFFSSAVLYLHFSFDLRLEGYALDQSGFKMALWCGLSLWVSQSGRQWAFLSTKNVTFGLEFLLRMFLSSFLGRAHFQEHKDI